MGVQKTKKSKSKSNKKINNKILNKNVSLSINKEYYNIHLRHYLSNNNFKNIKLFI
ncbi:hypothetical protein NDNC_0710 [Candidatus Nasuia deltocephalinicola]|nr:hypothetical protein NDNC_0710 [Candidatus Nasuia deltocephalinicola]